MRSRVRFSVMVVMVVMALAAAAGASPVHVPSWATPANDRGPVANAPLTLTVHLARSPEKQQAFDDTLRAQYTPGSPLYHQWLTPQDIGLRFGADDGNLLATMKWLRAQGFIIARVASSKTFLEVTGTATTTANAFGVQVHRYAVD